MDNAKLLSLKIRFNTTDTDQNIKILQFNQTTIVFDALKLIKEKIPELNANNNASNYGLYLPNTDQIKAQWLDNGRTLEYYMLKNDDVVEYRNKFRDLSLRLLDGQIRRLLVDDSQTVGQLMIDICSAIGIANYEEYSLIHDMNDNEKEKTATLKKDKTIQRNHKKMEELKKKLHTDDDIPWLDPTKTLRQQGIDDNSGVILKRKFFFSDKNIDTRDPVQLKLLYVQCRDGIINATHPIKEEEAIKFAALQCQVEFGDCTEPKHKSGVLDLKKFLPKEYVKVKGIEKKIFTEHKTLAGLNELDACFRYTQLCRSLKTYGVTFFLVKEKVKGKNKLIARLLGITKESIIRVDEKTKEFLIVYPLESVRKWAASPNTFTLDFGDHYKEPYYTMQTTEGENIARLISGYIDIIMKKKKAKEFSDFNVDEESPMVEEMVQASKATVLQINKTTLSQGTTGSVGLPGIIRNGQEASNSVIGSNGGKMFTNANMSRQMHMGYSNEPSNMDQGGYQENRAQRALLTTIDNARKVIGMAHNNLQQRPVIGEIGNDSASLQWKENLLDVNKQNISSHISAMNAATAQVLTLTADGPANSDLNAVGAAVASISANLGDFSKDVIMIAALDTTSGNDNERLTDAAKRLCSAFGEFMRFVEPDANESRQNLFTSATRIGEATNDVIRNIPDYELVNPRIQESIIGHSKMVASSTAGLVIAAKAVANHCEDQQGVNQVISLVSQCALSTSQLVSCTKLCVSTITSRECQEQIVEAARLVSFNIDGVVDAAVLYCSDLIAVDELKNCAKNVYEAISELLDTVKAVNEERMESKQDESIDRILNATDSLFGSMGDATEMIRQAKVLAQATTELVNSLKQEAISQQTTDQQRKLLHAAKLLAEATSKMVEAAKGCATNPNDTEMQNLLRRAAEDLRSATTLAAGDNLQLKLIKRLEQSAKQAASCATQAIATVQVCTLNNDQAVVNQAHGLLIEQCKLVADSVPRIVQGIRGCMVAPESKSAHLGLITSCEDFVVPTERMIAVSKAVMPTISDEIKSIQLRNATKQLGSSVADLRSSLSRANEMCGSFEAETIINTLRRLDEDLIQILNLAQENNLKQLPGETLDVCERTLGSVSKTVGLTIAQMLSAAAQRNEIYTGIAAKDTINAIRILANSVRGIIVCTPDQHDYHCELVDTTHNLLQRSIELIEETECALLNPSETVQNQQRLAHVARNISQALHDCLNCLPGQKEMDGLLRAIQDMTNNGKQELHSSKTCKPYSQIQSDLNNSAVNLNQATNEILIVSRKGTATLVQTATQFTNRFQDFFENGVQLVGKPETEEKQRDSIVTSLREASGCSTKLLHGVKTYIADTQAPNAKNQLAVAAKNVTESINGVINVCLENNVYSYAQKQCDNALRDIETIKSIVAETSTNESVKDLSYYDCLDQLFEQSRVLAESLNGVKMSAESTNTNGFVKYIKDVSDAVCGLIEASTQSSYLIGVSDIDSKRGKCALLDSRQFQSASKLIEDTCASLVTQSHTPQQLIQNATLIAHTAASLCNAARSASSKTTNAAAKRHFVQSAKQVANSTANLVKTVKTLEGGVFTQAHYNDLAMPLIESVNNLCQYAMSSEFQAVPAVISQNGLKAQEPILIASKSILDASYELVQASKHLITNNKEPQQWHKFALNSKLISESIKRLATLVKERAPAKFECDRALHTIEACLKFIENATISALNQSLVPPVREKSLQNYQEQAINSAVQITQLIGELKHAAKFEAEKLGHTVTQMSNYFEPLVLNLIGCASKTSNSQQQIVFLEQTKTILESASQLLIASKEGGGNSKNLNCHQAIDENFDGTKEALEDLIQTLEEATAQNGNVSNMVDNLSKAIAYVDEETNEEMYNEEHEDNVAFVDHHTKIVQLTKSLQKLSQDMSICQITDLGILASQLTQTFNALTAETKSAILTCANHELEHRLKTCIHDLGKACIDLVHAAGQYQNKSNDKIFKKELVTQIDCVNRKVTQLLLTFEANSRGTQACIHASSAICDLIADLDTCVLFATSGTLTSELETDSFNNHREAILKTAKTLVEDTKTLVTCAAGSQDELAHAAQSSVKTISKLSEAVKLGAAALGSKESDAQVLLINAVKDVLLALNDLVSSTKLAVTKSTNEIENLKESAKNMVTNVQSLLKTVKSVEDEAARGTRAVESAVEAIVQEIKTYGVLSNSQELDSNIIAPASTEDLIRAAKQITIATSKTVSAGTTCKQEDMIVAANMGRKAVSDLVIVCRGALLDAESKGVDPNIVFNVGYECAIAYKALLECLNMPNTVDHKSRLLVASKKVANTVSDIVVVAERLKGNDLIDPEDPTVIAEQELLSAANAIEAAARKISSLKPRENKNPAANENLNFDEQILEAARSITNAASALIKAATVAQQEITIQGKNSSELANKDEDLFSTLYPTTKYILTQSSYYQVEMTYANFNDDGQWSQGLISAARMVAAACHTLCEAANGLVQGHSTEERLISSAKQVASSTAALLVACKVKAGISSQAMKRLQNAGNAVKRATDALVRSSQQAVEINDEDKHLELETKFVGSMAQEIMLREEILRKERELKLAQEKYNALKKSKYQRDETSPGQNSGGSSTETASTVIANAYSSQK